MIDDDISTTHKFDPSGVGVSTSSPGASQGASGGPAGQSSQKTTGGTSANPGAQQGASGHPKPNFRSLADFLSEFRPISYAVAGLMRENSLYTLTGRTGEGKTSFLTVLALAGATGKGEKLIGRKMKKGRVAFATAENPDDLRMRLMVACFVFNIDPKIIDRDLIISDNRVRPEEIIDWIKETGEAFTIIIIDTWQAFFDGSDSNKPTEAVNFTRRFRPLAATAGLPVVVIAAHPPKQASDDALIPYGGGSTLNEIDGNSTLSLDDSGLYRFSWLGKIRGLSFDPLYFRIDRLDSPDVVTVDGERVQMPVMFLVDEEAVEARQEAFACRDLALLQAIAADPEGSIRKWADALRWSKRAVSTTLAHLKRDKLVEIKARRWRLTKAGEGVANKAKNTVYQNGTVPGQQENDTTGQYAGQEAL
jgi:KaiC/GvpD/RAD55 family RecA-like ATPase